jgi:hypothetical protein
LKSAELYDPASGQWYATGPLQVAQRVTPPPTPQRQGSGRRRVERDIASHDRLDSTELYDPITQWTLSDLNVGRFQHRATLLSDGQVWSWVDLSAAAPRTALVVRPCQRDMDTYQRLFMTGSVQHTATSLQEVAERWSQEGINDSMGPLWTLLRCKLGHRRVVPVALNTRGDITRRLYCPTAKSWLRVGSTNHKPVAST